jgi:uncharacterized alkaline shock family protein YloU
MTEGKTTIAPEVLQSIARLTALNVPGVSRLFTSGSSVNRFFQRGASQGVELSVQDDAVYADLHLILKNDVNIRDVSRNIQIEVARAISEMVGMVVGRVNIHIEDIDYPNETEA